MIRVGFLTTLGVNVGDEFIRNGVRAILDRTGTPYTPLYINKHDPASLCSSAEDEDIVATDKFYSSEIFLQSGAPVYWNLKSGANSLNSEWHQWMWLDRILASTEAAGPIFANLGAGSCQSWNEGAPEYLAHPGCAEFARLAHIRARLTTVRDPVGKAIINALGYSVEALPCPAFLAAARWAPPSPRPGVIGVNFMPMGSHYDLEGNFPTNSWRDQVAGMLAGLRRQGRLLFIAHDALEAEFQQQLLEPGERVFFASGWRDYLDVLGACSLVVANRVHGAVTAAGFGIPAIILGNDTRAQIGDYLGLPRYRSGFTDPACVTDRAAELLAHRSTENSRLLELRTSTLSRYVDLLRPIMDDALERASS
jgi:hypothetical protein